MWAWAGKKGKRGITDPELATGGSARDTSIGDPAGRVVARAAHEMSGCGRPVMTYAHSNWLRNSSADCARSAFALEGQRLQDCLRQQKSRNLAKALWKQDPGAGPRQQKAKKAVSQ